MNEVEQLKQLNKNEKRFLSCRVCAFCEMSLDREGSGAIFDKCDEETRIKRRTDALKTYKPRKRCQGKRYYQYTF